MSLFAAYMEAVQKPPIPKDEIIKEMVEFIDSKLQKQKAKNFDIAFSPLINGHLTKILKHSKETIDEIITQIEKKYTNDSRSALLSGFKKWIISFEETK